jgi:hypothetical protein
MTELVSFLNPLISLYQASLVYSSHHPVVCLSFVFTIPILSLIHSSCSHMFSDNIPRFFLDLPTISSDIALLNPLSFLESFDYQLYCISTSYCVWTIYHRFCQYNSCINWINLYCFYFTACFGHLWPSSGKSFYITTTFFLLDNELWNYILEKLILQSCYFSSSEGY